MSAITVLTPTMLTPAASSSSSSAPFPLSGSDGALPAVGGLDLALRAVGLLYLASRGPVKGSMNCVMGRNGQISQFPSPAIVLGISLVRNVSVPGAQVQDINKLLPNILNQHQNTLSTIVHVRFNYIMEGS